jgi:hypothetical protein
MPNSLEDLFHKSSNITDTDILFDLNLDNYCSGELGLVRDSFETTFEITTSKSSTQKTTASGTKCLSKFQYADMDDYNRPKFVSWKINDHILKDIVKGKFTNGSFDDFLLDLTEQLDKLRSIIYCRYILCSKRLWNETTHIQPMMQLFITYLLKKWNVDENARLNVAPANLDKLSIKFSEVSINWSGKTDLYCFSNDSEDDIYNSKAVFEMKVPFDRKSLFHSKALQSKQQLLGQSVGLFRKQPKTENRHTKSYLTDIFAISMLCYIKDVVYLAERVVDSKSFCLRLLLMCCELTNEEWEKLLPKDLCDVELDKDIDEHGDVDDRSLGNNEKK